MKIGLVIIWAQMYSIFLKRATIYLLMVVYHSVAEQNCLSLRNQPSPIALTGENPTAFGDVYDDKSEYARGSY